MAAKSLALGADLGSAELRRLLNSVHQRRVKVISGEITRPEVKATMVVRYIAVREVKAKMPATMRSSESMPRRRVLGEFW